MMKSLLENDLPAYYGVGRRPACVEECTSVSEFDLKDAPVGFVVPHGSGGASFVENTCQLSIINYDNFIEKFTPTVVEKGKRRCDFIMSDVNTDNLILLCELTSSIHGVENLSEPIKDKNGRVIFPRGKFEKVEVQLAQTLANITAVTSICNYIESKLKKICLMSYVISPVPNKHSAINAFNRSRSIEAQEAGVCGANVPFPAVEAFGFSYFRISHSYSFSLK